MDAVVVHVGFPAWERAELLLAEERRLLQAGRERRRPPTRAERAELAAVRAELDAIFPGPRAA